MIVDLHVHTNLSSDSNVAAEQYLEVATKRSPTLGAICFTEHRLFPADAALDAIYAELSERFQIAIFKGIEADTDLGHLLMFGVTREVARRFDLTARILKSEHLIEVLHHEGGVAIPAHPFRESGFGNRLDSLLSRHGSALAAIEVLNGQNSEAENSHAEDAALKLGLTAVGGSDAHFASAKWFMTVATELEREVKTVEQLCVELRAGRARPYVFPGTG
ncbi:MAG: PHP-associated domain-containing protein [Candidatus Binatus sp.]|uniref:PHP-associated domain-containing protein n=1 Tax=Candidatus Binatus sp. TaxID=2811406 RepID=UPI00271B715C|nr:PHP domain-containing protein [Candidatus Binatus sp.]MDO8430905.1 PHP-associated domain-containing protein [Candidatus Binatus sp.]